MPRASGSRDGLISVSLRPDAERLLRAIEATGRVRTQMLPLERWLSGFDEHVAVPFDRSLADGLRHYWASAE